MLEFGVVFDNTFTNKFLDLKNMMKCYKDIFVKIFSKTNESIIVFAVIKDSNNNQIRISCLKGYLSNLIINTYKKQIICKYLNLDSNNLKNQILINALVSYDLESEKQEVMSMLNFNQDLVLKSFCKFKLKKLLKKWIDMCNLTLENQEIIEDDKIFINLIKFLMSKAESKFNTLKVNIISSNLVEVIEENDRTKIFKINDLLNYIVCKNPKQVLIKNYAKQKHFAKINFLKNLINNKQFIT